MDIITGFYAGLGILLCLVLVVAIFLHGRRMRRFKAWEKEVADERAQRRTELNDALYERMLSEGKFALPTTPKKADPDSDPIQYVLTPEEERILGRALIRTAKPVSEPLEPLTPEVLRSHGIL